MKKGAKKNNNMKKIFLIFLLALPFVSEAQLRNVSDLSTGILISSSYIYDNNSDLFAYFYVYKLDKLDKTTTEYEYVMLDKNLNVVFNTKFVDKTHKRVVRQFSAMEYMEEYISVTSKYYSRKGEEYVFVFSSTQLISLKDKEIKDEFYYDGEKLESIPESFDEIIKNFKKNKTYYHSVVYGQSYGDFKGYVVFDKGQSLSLFDYEKKQLWKDNYNKEYVKTGSFKDHKKFSLETVGDGYMMGVETGGYKKTFNNKVRVLGLEESSDKNFEYLLQDAKSEFNMGYPKSKKINNEYHFFGTYSAANKNKTILLEQRLGFYRFVLDSAGNELSKKFFKWEELAGDLKIDRYGRLEKGYYLRQKAHFVFKNGKSVYLFEKYKSVNPSISSKTTDLVLAFFDEDFNYQKLITIDKEKTKGYYSSDYLFGQYIKDHTGAVFFFADKTDVKYEWILGINTIIDGEYNYEQMTLSNKDIDMDVMPAREGYILFREEDKKKETTELRLERLNY